MIPARVPRVLRMGPARLTAGLDHCRRLDLPAHRTLHGLVEPRELGELISYANEVDMRGRGGAAFPFARKLRAVADATGPGGECVVLVNGAEGEPRARAQHRRPAPGTRDDRPRPHPDPERVRA
ncbi:hypothetical protein AB0J43_17070, partial [Nonomuraea fuscirosea]